MERARNILSFFLFIGSTVASNVAVPQRRPCLTVKHFSDIAATCVAAIKEPKTVHELQEIVRDNKGPISIVGGGYSMGGQTAYPAGLVIDMKYLNNMICIDVPRQHVTVQVGMTWRQLQTILDPLDLSVKSMQSYSSFSIGGTLAVNAHGREIHDDPVVNSVQSLTIILANGNKVHASRTENADLFRAALGGYGLVGIIVEVTLSLQKNMIIESNITVQSLESYRDYFVNTVQKSDQTILHGAYLDPLGFEKILSVTWLKTNKPLTVKERLKTGISLFDRLSVNLARYKYTKKLRSYLVQFTRGDLKEYPFLRAIRSSLPFIGKKIANSVVWLNYEMSDNVASLAPLLATDRVSILQEYFIPVNNFISFVTLLKRITLINKINILNIGIRYVKADTETILPYAPHDCFAFVLYIDIPKKGPDAHIRRWTQELVNAALSVGGRYYLPYHLYPTVTQFQHAYPEYNTFMEIKKKYDPTSLFKNNLYRKYFEHTA